MSHKVGAKYKLGTNMAKSLEVHCVSKIIPNIIHCSLKKDYRILIIFGTNSQHNWPSSDHWITHLTKHLLLQYLGKNEPTNFYPMWY